MNNFPNCIAQEELENEEERMKRTALYHCHICGNEIYRSDSIYFMPDGDRVCDSVDCLNEWAEHYRGKAL